MGMPSGGKPYFEETWFELLFMGGCFLSAYLLFQMLMPSVAMSGDTVQTVAMAKLLAEGRLIDAFMRFNQPPVYPMLLAGVIKLENTIDLPRLVTAFQGLNLCLYFLSIALVNYFIRRQIRKPYSFVITALYALAPGTLDMAWNIGPQMAYMALSVSALIAIDYSLSKESAEGGQISRGELLMICLLVAVAILTQQMGYMLLIAFFFIMLKRFGLKKSALVLALLLLCISPFIGRDVFYVVRRPQQYVAPSATIVKTASQQGLLKTVQAYTDHMLATVTQHAVGDLNLSSLDQTSQKAQQSLVSHVDITHQPWGRWLLGMLAIIGVLYGLYQYTGVGSLYLSAYLITAIVLLPSSRLDLTPILPLILFYLYFGVMRTGEWMKRLHLPVSKVIGPALTVWILLCTFSTHLAQMGGAAPTQRLQAAHEPQVVYMSTAKKPENRLQEAQTISAHRRAMDWLKAHTPENAKIAIPRPEAAALVSKKNQSAAEQASFRKALGGYDYLVEEGAAQITPMRTKPGVFSERGLQLVYEDAPGRIRIWQVKPSIK
jgi:hypothetical protein